jgi:hypothetical protein
MIFYGKWINLLRTHNSEQKIKCINEINRRVDSFGFDKDLWRVTRNAKSSANKIK